MRFVYKLRLVIASQSTAKALQSSAFQIDERVRSTHRARCG